ncbi:MAG: Asp-tRNA(Asn)/Glu-tRNA(Gln) amidotransferase subunit GatB [Candidatus Buchananbacteria bacterium]|nr:Asp-tRNA(Asn)/Glu-tRNA(Gln) amidotransferase subunit GatB [Candidatus Buchananbacteria bacterium]
MNLTPIIGLEIHVQLKTKSKMFCGCDNSGENQPPNITVCPVCMGHPGVLPVANREAIKWTVMAGLALKCQIPDSFQFERKNYFYPDLPKGYQITSSTKPPCIGGYLEIDTPEGKRKLRLHHIHLEEDAAKNFHSTDGKDTLVDYNRSSTPLMEIVTEPDMRNPQEAKTFLQELRLIMRHLGISSADMEKGHLRCDANISLTDQINETNGEIKFYPKTEIKNLNSFKAVEKALEYEIKRQTKMWQDGKTPHQATRGWDENKGVTEEQRTKEEAHDYRYFPEPDIPPINLNKDKSGIDVEAIKQTMIELPQAKRQRFVTEYDLPLANAKILTDDKGLAVFFEQALSELRAWLIALDDVEGTQEEIWQKNKGTLAKLTSNWLINKLMAIAIKENKEVYSGENITPEDFAEFITLVHTRKVNSTIAQQILEKMFLTGKDPHEILEQDLGGNQQSNDNLTEIIQQVISQNQDQVNQYKAGKETVIQFLIGQVMKLTKGQADPQEAKDLLINELKK